MKTSVDFKALLAKGAIIIDVRTPAEYQQGHIKGSVNISLNTLAAKYTTLKRSTPVITCCASGGRSAQAENFLLSNGFAEVYNGGGWSNLNNKIN